MSTTGAPSGQGVYYSVPVYDYSSFIRDPEEMGASSDKSWESFNRNLRIGASYGEILLGSSYSASKTGGPLGMNYLLDTNTQCTATDLTGNPSVERFTFIQNNSPGGMIGGIVSDIDHGFNANNLELAFTPSINCQNVSLKTIDVNNMSGVGSAWVATKEIESINPCLFSSDVNTVTNQKCDEGFENYNDASYTDNMLYNSFGSKQKKEKDVIESVYLTGIMVFGLYLVYCFMKKTK
jgi:hypothetical protein